ncbi:glycosyltransferase family 4 protein [Marivirga atlantica]|uniref:Glycosyltransferase family 4 protein n=1 Tax=Marivirga atlantica TaxID=1548457 RepID=A0A937AMV5_9BACT|nr:glycosyltransferase family 4 protein [Marivirga atlantica]MBL0766438.1 glycosyltransferase family 4 protein [Marivirga atlantica]
MKILQIIQRPQLRGAEIFACQLSLELQKLGHDVDILILFGENNGELQYDLNYISLGAIQNKRFWDFKAYKRLAKIIRSEGYDLVQANAGDTLKYAALSKMLYKWKAKLAFRNANKMSDFIKSKAHLWLNQFFLNKMDFAISVSENCRQDLIRLYPKAKAITATGTIGTFDFSQLEVIERLSQNKVWINVGSFVKEKNHSFLMEIFAEYLKEDNGNELWLIGDGPLRNQLNEQVVNLGIEKKVRFLGYRSNAVAYIKAADIMVMPSKIEGLPGVILEALSCGKPVIASEVGGIPEVVINDQNGYIIKAFDKAEYISKIHKVLTNQELRKKMSQNAKNLIQEEFMMPKIAERFESIYHQILQL